MSLILDALKKLEQEKAARHSRQVELRPAITGRRDKPTSAPWRQPLLIASAIILAVATTIVVMGRFSQQNLPVAPTTAPVREESPRVVAPKADVALPAPVPLIPVRPPVAILTPPVPTKLLTPVVTPPLAPSRPKSIASEMTEPAPADLKVTGIAWQDERIARRAVVNGALLGEGAVVSGARVIEIRQDQVRFSRDGQILASPITSSNR